MPIHVAKDLHNDSCGTGMIFARVVPPKGVHPYAVKNLAADIGLLGLPEIILKSDGALAIVALKDSAKMERSERIVFESSLVVESKSSGAIE